MVAKFGDCVLLGGFAGFGWYGQGLNFWVWDVFGVVEVLGLAFCDFGLG